MRLQQLHEQDVPRLLPVLAEDPVGLVPVAD
jgi:hypothetical protein